MFTLQLLTYLNSYSIAAAGHIATDTSHNLQRALTSAILSFHLFNTENDGSPAFISYSMVAFSFFSLADTYKLKTLLPTLNKLENEFFHFYTSTNTSAPFSASSSNASPLITF